MGKRRIIIISILIASFSVFGQERVITVLNKSDNSPVKEAHVLFSRIETPNTEKPSGSSITDNRGRATVPIDAVFIEITHLGFVTNFDTLPANQAKTYYLEMLSIPLNEVVVTAQYSPGDPKNSVYQVKVIKPDVLDQKGATNLREALMQESNVRISQDVYLGSSLNLQGLGGEQIKILVDGVPVIGRENNSIDLSQINLNNASRIEVIEGPVSVQYGTNALGGVINVITDQPEGRKFNVDAKGYFESPGVYNFDGGVGFGKKKHYLSLSGGRYFFDGYSENDTSRNKDWKPKEQYFGALKYSYGFKRMKMILSGSAFSEKITDRGEPKAPYYINAFDQYFYTRRYTGSILVSGNIIKNHYFEQMLAYSFYSKTKKTYFKDLVTLNEIETPNDDDQDVTKFDAYMIKGFVSRNKPIKKLNYQIGYDLNIERATGERIKSEKQMIGDYALFASFNYKPVDILTLQAGFRWSYNNLYKVPPTPALNMKINPYKNLILRISYARGFRTPSLKELYMNFTDINHDIKGNEKLKPEYSHNVMLNTEYSKLSGKHHFQLVPSFFFNDIDNLISLVELQPLTYQYENIEKQQTVGGNLSLGYQFVENFSIKVNGGYTGGRSSLTAAGKFFFSPEMGISVNYMVPKARTTISIFNKYNGQGRRFVREATGVAERNQDAYNLLDISLNQKFWKDRISLTAGMKNLLNVNSVSMSGGTSGAHGADGGELIAWGRTFFTSLKFSFTK